MAGSGAASSNADDDGGGIIAEINVTPLVDITLVLLIIFMVAAPMIVNNPSIKVQLPKAPTGEETLKSTLALTLESRAAGGYALYLNGKESNDAELAVVMPTLLANHQDLQAIIAADRGIAYGDVIHIVDRVKALGVTKFALNTDAQP